MGRCRSIEVSLWRLSRRFSSQCESCHDCYARVCYARVLHTWSALVFWNHHHIDIRHHHTALPSMNCALYSAYILYPSRVLDANLYSAYVHTVLYLTPINTLPCNPNLPALACSRSRAVIHKGKLNLYTSPLYLLRHLSEFIFSSTVPLRYQSSEENIVGKPPCLFATNTHKNVLKSSFLHIFP